jgi:hypothetical protein
MFQRAHGKPHTKTYRFSESFIRPYGTKVPYRRLIRIDTLLLGIRNPVPFFDHVDDRMPKAEDP